MQSTSSSPFLAVDFGARRAGANDDARRQDAAPRLRISTALDFIISNSLEFNRFVVGVDPPAPGRLDVGEMRVLEGSSFKVLQPVKG
mmetsp:Transcript_4819/g.10793  ORF Transcript_4819/g.10793 Transcript_4819/m.10793 type:complete len:87 (-) Transcript_4819:93-353(-)